MDNYMLPNNRQFFRSVTERCSDIHRSSPAHRTLNTNLHHNNNHSSHHNTRTRIRNSHMYLWVLREVARD
jgi:hypothetical protein